ncbi:MAG TPA: hypothetical protein VFR59_04830 [Steroidobacteraceae bacterium]|nr:hypothetical protein [Steroidobacteraceae bacterium]
MGLSETILAAMIGAAATIMTAIFQLVMAFRNRARTESRPKRGSAVRSLVSVFAIILASAVAGFGYSELRAQSAREDTRGLREELKQQMQALNSYAEQLRMLPRDMEGMITLATARSPLLPGNSESYAHVGQCRGQPPAFGNSPVACAERDAQRLALCAVIPAEAAVEEVQLYARAFDSQVPWEQSRVAFEQDAGGLKFTDAPFEVARDERSKAVCANLAHWNGERSHAVRMVVLWTPRLNPTAHAQ